MTATAVFAGGWAMEPLWLLWIAPIVGAALAGVTYSVLAEPTDIVRGRAAVA